MESQAKGKYRDKQGKPLPGADGDLARSCDDQLLDVFRAVKRIAEERKLLIERRDRERERGQLDDAYDASGLGSNKKSRGCLAGGATLTANYSRPNEAQHARQIALGWAARDAAAGPLPRQAPTARAAVPHPRRSPPPPHAQPSNSYVDDRAIERPLRGVVLSPRVTAPPCHLAYRAASPPFRRRTPPPPPRVKPTPPPPSLCLIGVVPVAVCAVRLAEEYWLALLEGQSRRLLVSIVISILVSIVPRRVIVIVASVVVSHTR